MEFDLTTMTRPALKSLQQQVKLALADCNRRKKEQAMREIIELASRHGFTLTDLFGAVAVKKLHNGPRVKPGNIKYRNPDDPEQTWTGNGRNPNWIKQGLEAGKSLADYRV